MRHQKGTEEYFEQRFNNLSNYECNGNTSAENVAGKLGCSTKEIELAWLDKNLVWAKVARRKVLNLISISGEAISDESTFGHAQLIKETSFLDVNDKLYYYDADVKKIQHISVVYNSNLVAEKAACSQIFMFGRPSIVKAFPIDGNSKSFIAWFIPGPQGHSMFFPVFDSDIGKLYKNGKRLPKKNFEVTSLNNGQTFTKSGRLYAVNIEASKTSIRLV